MCLKINTPCSTKYWSLSICGLRDKGYAKVWKQIYINGHMKVQEEKEKIYGHMKKNIYIWTHEGPIIYMRKKWWAYEGSCKMIATFS